MGAASTIGSYTLILKGTNIMDWMFYLIVFLSLFALISALLTIRYLLSKRLEKIERKRQVEEDARQTAESNSGL